MRAYLKKLQVIVSLLLVLAVFNISAPVFAYSGNQSTGDISIQVDTNYLKVDEKFKIVLKDDNIKRDLNIKSSEINNVSAHLIFPTRENLNYTIDSNGNNTSINIPIPHEKVKEVVVTLSYSIEKTDKLIKALENKEEIDLIYPSTNTSLARLTVDLKSNVSGIEDYTDYTVTSNNDTTEHPNSTNKTQDTPNKTSKGSTGIWDFIITVKNFVVDIIILLICCIAIVIVAIAGYIFYHRYRRYKKKKFYMKSKKKKKSFNTQKKKFK